MPTCWIIEVGKYSNYHVVGIFSSLANAERALAYLLTETNIYDEPSIVERTLDPGITSLNEGLTQYIVNIPTNESAFVRPYFHLESEDIHWRDGSAYVVWATSPDHALKIAAERHTQWQMEPRP